MDRVCDSCAVRSTNRCPYCGDVPESLAFGCYRYIKCPIKHNQKGKPTRCMRCRFLFHKAKEDKWNKSFIMCGCVPSETRKIKPVPFCPYYKPLRIKQAAKARKNRH